MAHPAREAGQRVDWCGRAWTLTEQLQDGTWDAICDDGAEGNFSPYMLTLECCRPLTEDRDHLRAALTLAETRLAEETAVSDGLRADLVSRSNFCDQLRAELEEAKRLLNTPEILDFTRAVQLEAAHQRARWGNDHDAGKTDADWFWLIGYLGGKALRADDGPEKQLHRIITVAAAACNWHAAKLGQTNMRPGIETPKGEAL